MLLRFMAQELSGKAAQGRFSREYVDSLVRDPVPLHREEPSVSPQDEVTAPFAVPREPSLMVVPSQSSADVARKRLGVKASPVKPRRRRTLLWVGVAATVLLMGGAASVYVLRPMWLSSMVPGLSGIFPARADFAHPVAPVTKPHPWVNPASIAYEKAKAEASIPPVTSTRSAGVPPVVATARSSRVLAPVFTPPTAQDRSAPLKTPMATSGQGSRGIPAPHASISHSAPSVVSPVDSTPAVAAPAVGTPAGRSPDGHNHAARRVSPAGRSPAGRSPAKSPAKSAVGSGVAATSHPHLPAATHYVPPHPVWHPLAQPKVDAKSRLPKSAVRTLDAVF